VFRVCSYERRDTGRNEAVADTQSPRGRDSTAPSGLRAWLTAHGIPYRFTIV